MRIPVPHVPALQIPLTKRRRCTWCYTHYDPAQVVAKREPNLKHE